MKKFGVALFVLVLWLTLSAFGQDTSQQQSANEQKSTAQSTDKSSTADQQAGVQEHAQQGSMSQGQMSGKKAHAKSHLMGKISDDGKTLTDKKGQSWTIDNPDAVKGHEGHEVSLRGDVDTASNTIHVKSVKMSGEHASKKKGGAMSEQPPQ